MERELRSVNEALQLKGERRRSVSVSTPTVPAEATILKRVRFLSTNGDSSEFYFEILFFILEMKVGHYLKGSKYSMALTIFSFHRM